jgi:hypothetical protein
MDILSTLLVLIGLGFGSIVVFFASRKILKQLFAPAAVQPAASRFAWVNDPADANRRGMPRTVHPTNRTKRQAMYEHMHQVGPELRRRHGAQRYYRPQQVREVMTSGRASRSPYDYDCYGYATYCDREDFNEYHRSIGESCDYGAMRQEICESFDFLPGGAEFDAFDVFDVSERFDNLEVAGGSGVDIGGVSQSSGWNESSSDGVSSDGTSNALFNVLENADDLQPTVGQWESPPSSLNDDAPSSGGSFWSSLGDLFSAGSSSSNSSSSDSSSYSSSDSSSSSSSDSSSSSSSDSSSSSSSSDY